MTPFAQYVKDHQDELFAWCVERVAAGNWTERYVKLVIIGTFGIGHIKWDREQGRIVEVIEPVRERDSEDERTK